ncbi:MAG: hypothetical protein GTN99_02950 [Candidatus Dadabacteria bacterium]|nr:hypothetical protein [Candidatus Dadabacteria bacterium]
MTTIAFDGKILAADSRIGGDYNDDTGAKIQQVGSAYIGIAGSVSAALLFIKWFRDQTKPRPEFADDNNDFYCLVIRKEGKKRRKWTASVYDNNMVKMETGTPAAIGSGSPYAIAAMACGKNAIDAVKIARQFDPYTGGRIKSINLDP